MKKTLLIPMFVVMFVIIATTSVFAAGNLADQIYTLGKPYGVTTEHKEKIQEFFDNHPATKEQEEYVMAKVKEAIAVMDAAGVKNVTKLSTADQQKVQKIVKDAANKLNVNVKFTMKSELEGNYMYVEITKAGSKKYYTLKFDFEKATLTTAGSSKNKYVYTGANNEAMTFAVISLGVMVVASATVVKLRKNA